MRASSTPHLGANSRGYSAFQYVLRGLTPKRIAARAASQQTRLPPRWDRAPGIEAQTRA